MLMAWPASGRRLASAPASARNCPIVTARPWRWQITSEAGRLVSGQASACPAAARGPGVSGRMLDRAIGQADGTEGTQRGHPADAGKAPAAQQVLAQEQCQAKRRLQP